VVKVTPNCAVSTNTAWDYVLQCQESLLICKDKTCYCYPLGWPQQIKLAKFDGCGSSKTIPSTLFGWIFDVGDVWGFTPFCNQHDICYGTCRMNKSTCDNNFCVGLENSCLNHPNLIDYARCLNYADVYCQCPDNT
jgi:hypothetical protein